jgi:probable rRNA maturation factor
VSPQVWVSVEEVEHDPDALVADAQALMRHAQLDDCELSLVLCSDPFIHRLNQQHRGVDAPTDVLSFPMRDEGDPNDEDPVLGDVVISVHKAARQAAEHGHALEHELRVLLVHGFLHLLGYDHETGEEDAAEMRAAEGRLLAVLQAEGHGLIARAAPPQSTD